MGAPALSTFRKRATYQDVLDAPDNMVAEIMNGDLYLSPRPAPAHAETGPHVLDSISPFWTRRGGSGGPRWRIMNEPELHLGTDVLVPDLAGWRIERMPKLPREAFITLAPDWVCEVLSPSTARTDRSTKMRIYARHRVPHLWLVDPLDQLLEAFRLEGEFWVRHTALIGKEEGTEKARIPPFEELEINISHWWTEVESPNPEPTAPPEPTEPR